METSSKENKIVKFSSDRRETARTIPDDRQDAKVFNLEQEREERRKKSIEGVVNFRDEQYAQDIEKDSSKENMLSSLERHNKIVLEYANDLIEDEKLSPQDRVAATIATIMHDSGKLSSDDLEHHKRGVQYTQEMLEKMQKENRKFEGVEITQDLKQKILQAIERHMNHPFLIKKNGGKRFPEPENIVDKVVYDADMLANIGFKNVGVRLGIEKFLEEDLAKANEKKTNAIEEAFKNVMDGVDELGGVVLTSLGKRVAKERIEDVNRIFEYFKENKVFENMISEQSIFEEKTRKIGKVLGVDSNVTEEVIAKENSAESKKNKLNLEIAKAGMALGIDSEIVDKLMM